MPTPPEAVEPAVPRPAATVVLVRPADAGFEVLLTQRPSTMAFAPDVHVFPGGAVDPDDGTPERAALRELEEEAAVRLGSIHDLVPLSRWVTPPFVERRFDVRFFVARLPPGVQPVFSPSEVVGHRWLTPRAALDAMARGEIDLWTPTSTTLQQLEHAASLDDVRARLEPGPEESIALERLSPEVVRVVLPCAGAVPGQRVDAYVVGRRDLVVIDPGDPSDAAADALLVLADGSGGRVQAIALTSAAPDHAAGAEALAGRLGIPIFGGPGIGHDLAAEVVELAEGDSLPAGDVELLVLTTPGSRPDHVAFVAPGSDAVFCGDLFGPPPRRSILPPPDVDLLAASRLRVEGLGAAAVLGGHDV